MSRNLKPAWRTGGRVCSADFSRFSSSCLCRPIHVLKFLHVLPLPPVRTINELPLSLPLSGPGVQCGKLVGERHRADHTETTRRAIVRSSSINEQKSIARLEKTGSSSTGVRPNKWIFYCECSNF